MVCGCHVGKLHYIFRVGSGYARSARTAVSMHSRTLCCFNADVSIYAAAPMALATATPSAYVVWQTLPSSRKSNLAPVYVRSAATTLAAVPCHATTANVWFTDVEGARDNKVSVPACRACTHRDAVDWRATREINIYRSINIVRLHDI